MANDAGKISVESIRASMLKINLLHNKSMLTVKVNPRYL